MAAISLPGLQTGIDTSALISKLMEIESQTKNIWVNRKSLWEQKQKALTTLETKLTNLRTSVRSLSDSDQLREFNVSSSNEDKITAEATNSAFEGNHTVEVNQLATAERWVHSTGTEYAEDYVGAGTFIYSYNYKETSITTTATTTLTELVGLINNDANNPGVTASLLHYNNGYHLVLNGEDAGSDYKININSASTEIWKSDSEFTEGTDNATLNTKIIDLDQFSGTLAGNEKITISGTDHFGNALTSSQLNITEHTTIGHLISEINDAYDGRAKAVLENGKIVLTDSTSGTSSLSIALAWDAGGGGTSLTGLGTSVTTEGNATTADLSGYTASDFTKSQSAQDAKMKVDGFPSDSTVSEVQTATLSQAPDYGTFTLTYRGETTAAINYNADAATIKAALEALSTVNTNDITVSGSIATGTTFTFADSLGNVDLLMINSSMKNGGAGGTDVTAAIAETTAGTDGYISRSSNTVDDVISGVALHLHDTTTATGEQITLTRDIQTVKDKIDKMVVGYNAAIAHIKEVTKYDDTTKTAGVLIGDYVVSTIQYQIREPLIEKAAGFLEDVDNFLMPLNVGLELDSDGLLSFDSNAFDEAIAKDYTGVLDLIGANKTGNSDSDTIGFYGANNYTTAGTYQAQVTVSSGAISATDGVKIKLSSDSAYRNMEYNSGLATGISSLDDNGDPDYAECGLQLTIDESSLIAQGDGTYTATVYVKQGFAGKIEDIINRMLKATVGSIPIDQDSVENQIEYLQKKIDDEDYRLEKKKDSLTRKFSRLEKTISLIQGQMSAMGILNK